MKRIYLDQNIWLDIQLGRFDSTLESVLKKIDRKKVEVVFSPAHCEEICNASYSPNIKSLITSEERDFRLDILSKVTRNREIVPYANDFNVVHSFSGKEGPYIVLEHPSSCFKRVYDNYESNKIAESAQQSSLNKASEVGDDAKSKLGNINILNLLESDLIAKNLLLQKITTKLIHNAALNQLIKAGEKIQPCTDRVKSVIDDRINSIRNVQSDYFSSKAEKIVNGSKKIASEGFSMSEAVIDAIMLSMIELGYGSKEVTMSSLHDNTHAIYGSYCDIFVSRDQKLLKKIIPAYKYLGIKTKVINAKIEDWQLYLS